MKNTTRCFALLFVMLFSSQIAIGQIVSEGFNGSQSLFTISGGSFYAGNSASGDGPGSSPFFSEGTGGYGATSATATLTTTNNINTSTYTGIALSFKLAAFSIGGNTNGLDATDMVTVEVSPDGGTNYYSTVRVLGFSNAYWAYGATGIASTAYDGNATPVSFQPTAGGAGTTPGYSTVTVTGLPAVTTLKVRITLLCGASERWVIDNFQVTGTPAAVGPEINVQGNSVSIVDGDTMPNAGDHTDFGNTNIAGGSVTRTFTIQNTGTANLVLNGPAVVLNEVDGFTITSQPASPITPGNNSTFQITFDPSVGGSDSNTILIGSDDSDEGTYSFDITGIGTIDAPVAIAATNQLANQFDANWNAVTGATSYRLDVSTNATFIGASADLVSWNFPNNPDNATADSGIAANTSKTLAVGGGVGTVNYTATGATSRSANAPGWDSGNNTKYWEVEFATTGYYNIKVSSKQRSSSTGPRDFKLQYKIGAGGTYADVGATVTTADNYTTGVLTNISLPIACENQSSVYLRWIMTSNTSVGNGVVANTGGSNIDDISIAGNLPGFVSGYNDLNVGNVTTHTVTGLTLGTTYYYRVRAVSGAATSVNSNTITVAPVSVGGTIAPGNQTICSGTAPADLVLSGHVGNVVRWEKASDISFTTPTTIVSTATTLTGAVIGNLTAATYFRAVVQNGAAATAYSSTANVSVDPAAAGGTVNGSATVCSATNSGALTLSGNTGNVVQWESSTDNFSTAGTVISNTTATLNYSNVAVTTYYRAYVQSGNCFAYSTIAIITVGTSTTTWDGNAWSNGDPDIGKAAIFTADYQTSDDMSACAITVTNGATFTISNGSDVTVNNSITVDSGSNLIIQNNGNLIQQTNASNSGEIHVFRMSSAIQRLDYTLWSSPVAGQNLLDFSPLTIATRFYTYNTSTNQYNTVTPSSNDFTIGKGYLIRMPDDHPTTPTNWFGEFIGVPHNGDVNVTMANGGSGQRFNLIGNPYPCTVNMNEFVDDNSSNITGTLYFWRKTNNAASPSYCTWSQGGFVSNGEAEAYDPLGVLQTGQGFLVEAAGAATTVQFNNSQRIGNNDGQFFRNANITEKNRIWLNATNEAGAYSQMLVGYMTDATSGVDYGIDGKYINDGPIALNSIIDATDYAIQGRALPFEVTDVVPLSFKATTAGNYSIAIDHTDGFFTGIDAQDVFLRDNSNGTVHDLNDSAYTFASEAGTFASRFELIFESQLGVSNPDFNADNVVVYSQNGNIVINSGNIIMDHVKVFDIRGRLVAEKSGVNASETTINGGNANQVLVVKITSDAKKTVTKKVVN